MEIFNYGCLVTASFTQTRHNMYTFYECETWTLGEENRLRMFPKMDAEVNIWTKGRQAVYVKCI
jgi:hypothetical protein